MKCNEHKKGARHEYYTGTCQACISLTQQQRIAFLTAKVEELSVLLEAMKV